MTLFPSLKQNFIPYPSSKVSSRPECIFEIHQLWQSWFSRVYSNSCCSCSFEGLVIKIGQLCYKMYSNNILNFQKSTTILNACPKMAVNLLKSPRSLLLLFFFLSFDFRFYIIGPYGIVLWYDNGPEDWCSIPGSVIPKTQKIVLCTTLLNIQHYKVRIKGKVEQSRGWSSTLSYTSV